MNIYIRMNINTCTNHQTTFTHLQNKFLNIDRHSLFYIDKHRFRKSTSIVSKHRRTSLLEVDKMKHRQQFVNIAKSQNRPCLCSVIHGETKRVPEFIFPRPDAARMSWLTWSLEGSIALETVHRTYEIVRARIQPQHAHLSPYRCSMILKPRRFAIVIAMRCEHPTCS
jgi:hypothetical protein